MRERFDADVMSALEAAREIARRHRHVSLEPEHLLRVLVGDDRLAWVFEERAVDRAKLGACVDGRLADWPAAGLYRDAQEPRDATDRLRGLLTRAGAQGFLARLRPVTLPRLALAASLDPRLAQLLFDARAEVDAPIAAFVQARTLALARGHDSVSVYHVLRALADQPWAVDTLRIARVDVDHLVSTVESRLAAYVSSPDLDVGFAVQRVRSREHLLGSLLLVPAAEHLLWEQQVASVHVLRACAHGAAASRDGGDDLPTAADEEPVEIVLHNDDFTTMSFVIDVLTTCFAVTQTEATFLTILVHERGRAAVKTCRGAEARWRIEKARAAAEHAGMPLRITYDRANDSARSR